MEQLNAVLGRIREIDPNGRGMLLPELLGEIIEEEYNRWFDVDDEDGSVTVIPSPLGS
jgi:hypothetical protein